MDKKIIAELDKELDPKRIKQRKVAGREVSYLESHDVINTANRIFRYGAWGFDITSQEIREVGDKTICIATVALSIDGSFGREDVGVSIAASPRGKLTPEALETAIKGAVSDAMKRCFRHFGNQFGNSLYSKEKATQKQPVAAKDPGQIEGVPDLKEREAAPDADTLRGWIHKRVEAKGWDSNKMATEKQLGLMNGLLSGIFGQDEMAERERHQFLDYIFDTLTSKTLNMAQASTLIDWAKDSVGNKPHPAAVAEGQMVVRAHEVEAGQEEFPGMGQGESEEPPF